jgi:hypothetical protein
MDEFDLKIVDKTLDMPETKPEPRPEKVLTPEEAEEKKKREEEREKRKQLRDEDDSRIPPQRFIEFCRDIINNKHDQFVNELTSLYGVRELSSAQKAAGVTWGKYSAAEMNAALESLAKKSGIRTRRGGEDKEEAKEEPKELKTIELKLE